MSAPVPGTTRKRLSPLPFIALFSLALLFACERKGEKPVAAAVPVISIGWSTSAKPTQAEPIDVAFQPKDETGKPLTGASIDVEANMTHPGMAPIYAKAEEKSPGTYVARMKFTMAGDWILFLTVKQADGPIIKQEIPLSGVE